MKFSLAATGVIAALAALGGPTPATAQDRRLIRNPADPREREKAGKLFSEEDAFEFVTVGLSGSDLQNEQQPPSVLSESRDAGTCADINASCVINGREQPCFYNKGDNPKENRLIKASGGQDMLDPDDKRTWPKLNIKDIKPPEEDPDESLVWKSPLGACTDAPNERISDSMGPSPDFDDPSFGYVSDDEDEFTDKDDDVKKRPRNGPPDDAEIVNPGNGVSENPWERPGGRHLHPLPAETEDSVQDKDSLVHDQDKEEHQDNYSHHRSLQSSSTYWTVGGISTTEIQLDLYLSEFGYNEIYISTPVPNLDLCWKREGQHFICNKNERSILAGQSWVTTINQYQYRVVIDYSEGSPLSCDTEYVFVVKVGSGWLGPLFGKKATTFACPLCAWGDAITAFTGNYVVQSSVLEYTNNACRLHRGDFNGDGRLDILRSCDNNVYNALWRGNIGSSGLTPVGYVIQGSVLEKSNGGCKLHIGDFNGDGKDDLLRTCLDPYYNALWYGNSSGPPFTVHGYVIQGSQLHNSAMGASAFRLHIGDFNGDGKADLLRVADNSFYNAVWYGAAIAFDGQSYQQQGFLLANSFGDCVLRLGNFDGDSNGTTDIFRSCQNASLNRLLLGQPGSPASVFSSPVSKLTGSVMDKKNKSCRSDVGDFNADGSDDLLRSCDNPSYNVIIYGSANPLTTGSGYINTATVLENSSNTCRLHLGDFNGDGKKDIFRSCNSRCYNAIFISQGNAFTADYTLTTGLLENSALTCKLHVGNYNGVDSDGARRDDLIRTCNNHFYNALFRAFL